MNSVLALLLLAVVAASEASTGKKWVLLCAGSNTWMNYRHQADIYHMYQIAKKGGIPDENIVVMHYDDIANYYANPMRGKVINKPNGPDNYHGVPKDFVGTDVNPTNFLAALSGDKSKVKCTNKKSACRVIESGPDDEVFVYFADHGGTGIICFQYDVLHAKDLIQTLQTKYNNKGFAKLTFYLEACESGSMFETLPKDINVYAVSAASPKQSSWAMYCPSEPSPYKPPKGFTTCLGDLFSVNFLNDMDVMSSSETLEAQFKIIFNETSHATESKEHPGIGGSQVMQWGDTNYTTLPVDYFVSANSTNRARRTDLPTEMPHASVAAYDAELISLQSAWSSATGTEKEGRFRALSRYVEYRRRVERTVSDVAAAFAQKTGVSADFLMRGAYVPSVQDMDCYKEMLSVFDMSCTYMGTYGLQRYSRLLANLCNTGVQPQQVAEQCMVQ